MSTSAQRALELRWQRSRQRRARDRRDADAILDYIGDELGGEWTILQALQFFTDASLASFVMALGRRSSDSSELRCQREDHDLEVAEAIIGHAKRLEASFYEIVETEEHQAGMDRGR